MKPKKLAGLGALTVVIACAAAWVATRSPSGTEAGERATGPLFAKLREHVNDVATVEITTSSESFKLQREGAGWGLADRGGYPVDVGKVKELVVGLAELTLVEEKTANPELWPRLELQDPTSDPEAPSKRVRLEDAKGELLADVVVGKTDYAAGGTQQTIYVRRAESGPALETRGRVRVEGSSSAWLDRQIAKLERNRVHEVTVVHPDGESLRVYRDSPDLQDFQVADLPEGAELSWAGIAGGVAGALEYLNLEDVLPAAEADFDEAAAVSARFTTFDGLVVTARTVERDDGKVLLKVHAAYDEAERVPESAGPPPPTEEGQPAADPPEPAGKTPEQVTAEAEAIDKRVDGWIYVIPGYSGANLRKHLDDLLKKPEEEAESMFEDEPVLKDAEIEPAPAAQEPAAPAGTEPLPEEGGGEPAAPEPGVQEPGVQEPAPVEAAPQEPVEGGSGGGGGR